MPIKQRAVNDEQKEMRRQMILDKAWELFALHAYDTINIIDIAKEAGIAKGTVYLYFNTKEHLFLALLEQKFETWFTEINAQLQAESAEWQVDDVVQLFTTSLVERPILTRLFAIAHVILEHNIDHTTAHHYKKVLLQNVMHTAELLEARLPFLQMGDGVALLLRAYTLVIGVEHVAKPAPIVAEVLDGDPALAIFKTDFASEFSLLFKALITSFRRQ